MTFAPATDTVTFDTGSSTRLSYHVESDREVRAGATVTPSSPPTRRSGPSWLFASVTTVPTRNCR